MKISIRDLSFGFPGQRQILFDRLNADFESKECPLVILGPSGSGKTTLLRLIGGLQKTYSGAIIFQGMEMASAKEGEFRTAFMFQEPRLLPWLNVLDNVSLPLEKEIGKDAARKRAMHFLSLVSLEEKAQAFPGELSGGQSQRVSMARAFAWPAEVLFMDEPFQSLDIPLRISLMDLSLSLLKEENRLLVAVTHDPFEAVYMGGRVIILGAAGEGIIFDKTVELSPEGRAYGSAPAGELEKEMIKALEASSWKANLQMQTQTDQLKLKQDRLKNQ